MKFLLTLIATTLLASAAVAQNVETRTSFGRVTSGGNSITVAHIALPPNRSYIQVFVTDKHVIESNLVMLSRDDAIRLRDMLSAAIEHNAPTK